MRTNHFSIVDMHCSDKNLLLMVNNSDIFSTTLVGSSLQLLVNVFSVQMQIPTISRKTNFTLSKRLPSSSSIKG